MILISIIASLIGVSISALIFALMFDSNKKLLESRKHTNLLKLIALKLNATQVEIEKCVSSNNL